MQSPIRRFQAAAVFVATAWASITASACDGTDCSYGLEQAAIEREAGFADGSCHDSVLAEAVVRLHNFEYEDARLLFEEVATRGGACTPMAYWGAAMTYNHPLWGEQDASSGQTALAKLDGISTAGLNARNQGLIAAVRELYGAGKKQDRDRRYMLAMADLYTQYPRDDDVAALYGLAILGAKMADTQVLSMVTASGVLEGVYDRNPNHPGVLHYLIHSYDSPTFASLGLDAAKRYATIAPDSPHALHMPSHIYLDLGMWREFVAANQSSWKVSLAHAQVVDSNTERYDVHALHSLQWLHYGHLQQGDWDLARERLNEMQQLGSSQPGPMARWYESMMTAAHVASGAGESSVDGAPADLARASGNISTDELTGRASRVYAHGMAAARDRKLSELQASIANLRAAISETTESLQRAPDDQSACHQATSFFDSVNAAALPPTKVMIRQLEALALLATGAAEQAIQHLQLAVGEEWALPYGYGPPVPAKPSAELLGEVYLAQEEWHKAARSFQMALVRFPGRWQSLAGLQKAATNIELHTITSQHTDH